MRPLHALSKRTQILLLYSIDLASLLNEAALIIWDEAPMSNKICFEALDRTMCDFFLDHKPDGSPQTFGGKTVVLGGDFRQTLPVIPGGNMYDTVSASIVNSPLWQHCIILNLTINMRLSRPNTTPAKREKIAAFAAWTLSIGNGTIPGRQLSNSIEPEWIDIPPDLLITAESDPEEAVINYVYPDLHSRYYQPSYLREHAIITPKNSVIDQLNKKVLEKIPGNEWEYLSMRYLSRQRRKNNAGCGLPPHRLILKKGAPIMLLRNTDQPNGLCNGTRLIVINLAPTHIQAEIITESAKGSVVYIPRTVFIYKNNTLPFMLRMKQFPVRLSYAMTINKSQGQSLDFVGVYLPEPVFAHGQLNVAVSRATSPSGLKILILPDDKQPPHSTKNVVYKEIFTAIVPDRPAQKDNATFHEEMTVFSRLWKYRRLKICSIFCTGQPGLNTLLLVLYISSVSHLLLPALQPLHDFVG